MTQQQGPSLRAQILGQRLAAARRAAKISMQGAAEFLQVDQSKISRMETAIYPARKADVLALLDFYAVSDERQRELMIQLTEDIWRKGWWDGYRKDVDRRFIDYPWLESRAERIMSFEVFALSGLVQTPDYARAIISHSDGPNVTEANVDRLVELRIERQRILVTNAEKVVSTVIDESLLYRPVGGTSTMREQLAHLLNLRNKRNVDIRVLPLSTGWHAGFLGQFALFEMPEPFPDVAYSENLAGQAYVEEPEDVDRFRRAYHGLQRSALNPTRSVARIKDALENAA